MKPSVLIAEPEDFTEDAVALLRRVADVELRAIRPGEMRSALAAYDVVWFRLAHKIDRATLSDIPRAKIIVCALTGLDHIDLEACKERGISVVSLRGEVEFLRRVRATAELTIGLAIALMRHVPRASESVLAGEWNRDLFRGHELFEKTAGVVGLGRLGTIVAEYFVAFGMSVLAYDPRASSAPPGVERVSTLHLLLGRADLVSLHVSYSPETRHLIDDAALRHLKPDAYLINTSRGGVVDTVALLSALAQKRLAGAALDVLDDEPHISKDHAAIRYARANNNLLIVPHIGGNTFESITKCEVFIAERVVEEMRARVWGGP